MAPLIILKIIILWKNCKPNHAKGIAAMNESLKLGDEIEFGGILRSLRFISPTIIRSNFESFIMKEEIFI